MPIKNLNLQCGILVPIKGAYSFLKLMKLGRANVNCNVWPEGSQTTTFTHQNW